MAADDLLSAREASLNDLPSGHSVKTIDRVARELGESVDWLFDIADEMHREDPTILKRRNSQK